MKTKQQQKDEVWEAYEAIREPAYEAYEAKLKKIDKQEEEGETIIKVKGKRYKLIED